MINSLKTLLKKLMPEKLRLRLAEVKNLYFDGFAFRSYSQEGEDMILRRMFEGNGPGFYVDIGAHHPKRFSNTYYFYLQGWRGINVDAMPGSMELFNRFRPRDINLEIPVSDTHETLVYHAFEEPALNSFSKELAETYINKNFRLKFTRNLETSTLAEILDQHLPPGQKIDFLSVDVEGLDLKVLRSNNWQKYQPRFILVEVLSTAFTSLPDTDVAVFLRQHGYEPHAKCENTVFFKRQVQDSSHQRP